jgi:MFS transporter, ACS family, hexuronate transporter
MKVNGLRWLIVTLIGIATVVNYIDRNALAVMWPQISVEIGATKEDYALLVTVFMIFYAIGQSVFGTLFDRIGTRMGFVLAIGVWSISIALHATARSVMSFSILRALLGVSEAGNWPGATKANAEWFPTRERAFAQGIFNAGASIGAIVSAPLIAFLFLAMGWKATFVLIGGLGMLWIIPWLAVYKSGPESHPWISESEREHILADVGGTAPVATAVDVYAPTVPQLLRHRQTWAVLLSRFFLDPIWWLFVSWLPIYLAETFGFDIKQIGMFAWVPYVGAMIGSLFGGWLAGFLLARGWSVSSARKWTITLGGALMLPALLLTRSADDPLQAVLLIAVILLGFQIAIGNIQTLPSDYFSGKTVGSLAGMSGTAAVVGVLVTTWLVPVMTKTSYAPIFLLAALLVPIALGAIWFLGGRVERVSRPA